LKARQTLKAAPKKTFHSNLLPFFECSSGFFIHLFLLSSKVSCFFFSSWVCSSFSSELSSLADSLSSPSQSMSSSSDSSFSLLLSLTFFSSSSSSSSDSSSSPSPSSSDSSLSSFTGFFLKITLILTLVSSLFHHRFPLHLHRHLLQTLTLEDLSCKLPASHQSPS
jgi:hypothetical protein